MSPALAAHLRLSTELPSRFHTWTPTGRAVGHKRSKLENDVLRRKLKEMEAEGRSRDEMRAAFGLGGKTIVKLLGRLKRRKRK